MEENERPWGRYDILNQTDNSKTKIIKVKPNKRLSLQYHNQREEHWTFIKGSGKITIGNETRDVSVGDTAKIPIKEIHRAEAFDEGLEFIEVAIGEYLEEDDIVRVEDDYGRIKDNE